jgi:hypothetical protein
MQPDFVLPNTSLGTNGQNGRVNMTVSPSSAGGFLANPEIAGFGYRKNADTDAPQNLLRGNWAENKLNRAFFSPENTQIIQNAIRKQVYDKSGDKKWIIDEQSVDELQIIMRAIYFQYGKNLETNIPGQIQELNDLVVEYIVPKVLSEVSMYYYYLNDISHLPVPLSHPVTQTSAGTKSLPFRKFM